MKNKRPTRKSMQVKPSKPIRRTLSTGFYLTFGKVTMAIKICTREEYEALKLGMPWLLADNVALVMAGGIYEKQHDNTILPAAIFCTTITSPSTPAEYAAIAHECVHLAQAYIRESGGYRAAYRSWEAVAKEQLIARDCTKAEFQARLLQHILQLTLTPTAP